MFPRRAFPGGGGFGFGGTAAEAAFQHFGEIDNIGAAAFALATGTGELRARPSGEGPGGGWVLDGTASHVLDGDRADSLALVASTAASGG